MENCLLSGVGLGSLRDFSCRGWESCESFAETRLLLSCSFLLSFLSCECVRWSFAANRMIYFRFCPIYFPLFSVGMVYPFRKLQRFLKIIEMEISWKRMLCVLYKENLLIVFISNVKFDQFLKIIVKKSLGIIKTNIFEKHIDYFYFCHYLKKKL